MYAIIESGGKQYRVAPKDSIEVELLNRPDGEAVAFEQVLFISNGITNRIGTPHVDGATVKGELVETVKGEKLINFKFKKRKNQRRKKGHRQHFSRVRILEITGLESSTEEVVNGT